MNNFMFRLLFYCSTLHCTLLFGSTPLSEDEFQKLVEVVAPIMREAGEVVMVYYDQSLSFEEKKHGLVTEADNKVEEFLMTCLHEVVPDASFLAEESGMHGHADYCWVIDPIDGTTNFAHGFPHFGISVALTFQHEPIFGMILHPVTQELFYAGKGCGAYCNGVQVHVSSAQTLKRSLMIVGYPYMRKPSLLRLPQLIDAFYAVRYAGSIAIDQAYVACGRADGIFFHNLNWWDVAAGMLLIEEAGGVVSTYDGYKVDAEYESYIGGNPQVHAQLQELFNCE